MEWVHDTQLEKSALQGIGLRLLEIGALCTDNACSRASLFNVVRIDLQSQHPQIQSQDFMDRPLPNSNSDRFDIISLSLVLNFVPCPTQRGEMLRRTTLFLRHSDLDGPKLSQIFPSLFLVLPAPCLTNSRYLSEGRLQAIMQSLDYSLLQRAM